MKKLLYLEVLIIMFFLYGCGSVSGSGANASASTSNTTTSPTIAATPTNVVPTPTPVPTDTPTPTFTPQPTLPPETIVPNFTCSTGITDAYKVPFDPNVLTIQFIQVTNLGNAVADFIDIKQVSNAMFVWKLRSMNQEVEDGINGYHFGVLVVGFTKAIVNPDGTNGTEQFPVAEVCSSWSTNEQPVLQGSY